MPISSTVSHSNIQTEIGSSIYQERKKILENFNPEALSNLELQEFEKEVHSWYPIYREMGIEEYNQSSIIWRIWTYVPLVFESYDALGKTVASSDIKKLKEFLKKDIPKKIQALIETIKTENQFKRKIEFAQGFTHHKVQLKDGSVCRFDRRALEKFRAKQLLAKGK